MTVMPIVVGALGTVTVMPIVVGALGTVTVMPIVVGALGTVTKGLSKGLEDLEIRGRVETIRSTTLLRSARILRRVLETRGYLLSLKLQ